MDSVTIIQRMIADDPILSFLANGGSWADAVEMDEERQARWAAEAAAEAEARRVAEAAEAEARRVAELVPSIPKWEGQLAAVLRKPVNPSALGHKARLVASLREAYALDGWDPALVDAFLAAEEAKVAAERAAKAAAAGPVGAGAGPARAAPKPASGPKKSGK